MPGRCLPVLKGLDLELENQGITVILGRSGCGKTTLLRLIAGLEKADSGEICWTDLPGRGGKANGGPAADEKTKYDGREVVDEGNRKEAVDKGNQKEAVDERNREYAVDKENRKEVVDEENRKEAVDKGNQKETEDKGNHRWSKRKLEGAGHKIGLIFQEPRLMPWLTVEKNILFGVADKGKDREKLCRLLELTGLTGFEKAKPFQLSGGMQQRVALARALAYGPDFLLMDEPFAALDYFTRKQMQQELLKIHKLEKKGILFVTHSIEEALTLGTHLVILENGICSREYDLWDEPFPRDLLSKKMTRLKRELTAQIEGGGGNKES